MRQAVADSYSGSSDVDDGRYPFEFVVSGSMEEVTQPDNACSFSSEVYCQARRAAAEEPCDGIQLSPAIRQVGPSDGEVSRTESGHCRKQHSIFDIPESVLAGRLRSNGVRDG